MAIGLNFVGLQTPTSHGGDQKMADSRLFGGSRS